MLDMFKTIKVYEVYNNDEYICPIKDEQKLIKFLENKQDYYVKKVDCYCDLNSILYDEDSAYDYCMIKSKAVIDDKVYEYRTEGTNGFCAMITYMLLKQQGLWSNYTKIDLIEANYRFNEDVKIKTFTTNKLVNDLLCKIDENNFRIIQYLIDIILDNNLESLDDLREPGLEDLELEDMQEENLKNILKEAEQVLFYDLCIYDLLSLKGHRVYSKLKKLYEEASLLDKVKYFIIIEVFKHYDVYFTYNAYKMIINDQTPVIEELKLRNCYF